jgi:putative heme-binding domain-containing protein
MAHGPQAILIRWQEMSMRFVVLSVLGLAVVAAAGPDAGRGDEPTPPPENISSKPPRTPAEELKAFRLPPGFEAQLVAAEPDIGKPINIAFDARGRLWVTQSFEYPFPAEGHKGHDRVSILEDFGPDGRARKITTFANDLNIPIGVLPLPHGAMVYSIPNIYRLTDTAGDGKAGQRRVLYGTYGHRDTHGMTGEFTPGFDGWVYACHGYSNTSTVKGADGQAITMNSGNTYRMRPDGSHVEYFTHGQVNPFGLTFDALGNLFSCDCHTKPIMMLLRGGYYDSFGKPHDGLGYAPEMLDRYDDSTAIAGIAYYDADQYPAAYRGSAYVGDVVVNNVVQFSLTWHGSSPQAKQHTFLHSADPWFRPVSIQLGPDGALYVADFYNRIIGHYEVDLHHPGRDRNRGRIWRIVYRGDGGSNGGSKDWTKATVDELVQGLAHPNLTVRMTAMNQLVVRGGRPGQDAVRRVCRERSNLTQRVHGLWVLERQGALGDALLTEAAHDPAGGVRVHAQHILAERRELTPELHTLVLAGLKDRDAFVQRAAADALGLHPADENIRPLLDLRDTVPAADTHLLYTVRMALRNQLQRPEAWERVKVTLRAEHDLEAVADVALGVPTRGSARFLLEYAAVPRPVPRRDDYLRHVARFGDDKVRRMVVAYAVSHCPADLGQEVALFRAIQQGVQEAGAPLSADARKWAGDLVPRLLRAADNGQVLAGIELVGTLRLRTSATALATILTRKDAPEGQRRTAVNVLLAVDTRRYAGLVGQFLTDPAAPAGLRDQAATALGGTQQPEAQAQLLQALETAPASMAVPIASALAASRTGGEKLLGAVAAGKASARLLQERPVQVQLEARNIPNLKGRVAQLTQGLPPADQRVQDLLRGRREEFLKVKHDLARGAQVFEKNCAICHQLGGKGAKVGPQLDGVGHRGLDRLLEDILDPNRNVDQAFRATTLNLKSGQLVSGLLLREEGAVLVMADAQGKEVRVPKDTVDERIVSPLSPMPANLVEQIPEGDFYHLLAFLLAQQASPKDPAARK